jgi:hypothetical protein
MRSKAILIILALLTPLIVVSIYAATRPGAKPAAPRKTATAPTATPNTPQSTNETEQFLTLPGSANIDSAGKPLKAEPQVQIPTQGGVGISGGFDWNNRSSVIRNSLAFGKDFEIIDTQHPQATFKRMSLYMASGALQHAEALIDTTVAPGQRKAPKLKYVFLYDDPQTGTQKGKLVYVDKTFFTVEYAPSGKILQLFY